MPRIVQSLSPATDLARAGTNLARIVRIQATATAQLVGFGWQGDPKAPADYRSLLRAYARSQATGQQPLPVSDEYDDETIYGSEQGNLAFRFWHDVTHVRLAALAQLDVISAAGFGPGTLEFELLHAETLGQTLCGAATGTFPNDQACFARMSIESSLTLAIRAQMEKQC